ncbi:hypothetical protein H9X96_03485 [Pedobacter sp. N36a]|uniref:hypothetical protein n=1 Tax=Pedobacter sp. N36a TaxID=2767996 RepID=UPI00165726CF|nr:hypothetical protein [Pedobacter sp. N36a]MBC8984833.1 hypothetical protein [Pedobacter sp. N36a]
MGKVEEPWEPFDIQVLIEGQWERLLVIPDREEPKYELFDQQTSVGQVWPEQTAQGRVWCAEGLIAKELADQAGEQIDQYYLNKPE